MAKEWSPLRAYRSTKSRRSFPDLALLLLLVTLFSWLYHSASRLPSYHWNWDLLRDFIWLHDAAGKWQPGLLLRGLLATIRISFWTIIVSFAVGGMLGSLTLRRRKWIRIPAFIFINVVRNTPPLVILFCVYFFAGNILPASIMENAIHQLPQAWQGIVAVIFAPAGQMDAMLAAIIALGFYQGAYVGEIVRGGLLGVSKGQWDASRSLGFGYWQTLAWVILPQALRLIIPPLTGQCMTAIKESALASLISLPELTFQSLEIMAVSNMTFEIWFVAGLLYLALGVLCAFCGRWFERRLKY